MSDNISVDEIRRKIHDGLYETFQRDVKKNDLWKCFHGIRKAVSAEAADGSAERQSCNIPYVQCKQEAQLMLTTGSTRLAVSQGQQT